MRTTIEDELKVRIVDANGKEKIVEKLFQFHCDELNKDYLAVTDWTYSKNGELNITLLHFTPNVDVTRLDVVTDKDEIQMAEDILEEWKNVYEAYDERKNIGGNR